MSDLRGLLQSSIQHGYSVDAILQEYIRQSLSSERQIFTDIDDSAYDAITYIGNGTVFEYHNPFYNGDGTNKFGIYWKVNDHTLNPIIPSPSDIQIQQARALRKRVLELHNDAVIAFALMMREYNLK